MESAWLATQEIATGASDIAGFTGAGYSSGHPGRLGRRRRTLRGRSRPVSCSPTVCARSRLVHPTPTRDRGPAGGPPDRPGGSPGERGRIPRRCGRSAAEAAGMPRAQPGCRSGGSGRSTRCGLLDLPTVLNLLKFAGLDVSGPSFQRVGRHSGAVESLPVDGATGCWRASSQPSSPRIGSRGEASDSPAGSSATKRVGGLAVLQLPDRCR